MDFKDNLFLMQSDLARRTFLMFRNKFAERRYVKELPRLNRTAITVVLSLVSLHLFSMYLKHSKYECLIAGFLPIPAFFARSFYRYDTKLYIDIALMAFKVNSQPGDSLFELLGVFLPSFLISFLIAKSFMRYFFGQLVTILVLKYFANLDLQLLFLIQALYLLAFYLLEIERRRIWIYYYSYMKSNYLYYENLKNSNTSLMICSSSGQILHCNDISKSLMELLDGNSIFSIFPEKQHSRLKEQFLQVSKGKQMQESLVFKVDSLYYGFNLQAKRIVWNNSTAIECSLVDISDMVGQVYFVSKLLREMEHPFADILKSLTSPPQQNSDRDLLFKIHEVYIKTLCVCILQGSLLSSNFTIKKDRFSIERESRKIIDSKFDEIYERKLTASLTIDLGVPTILLCDKSLFTLLFYSLLKFSTLSALSGSNISFLTANESSVLLNLKAKISYNKDLQWDFNQVFTAVKGSKTKKLISEIYQLKQEFGIELSLFDEVLQSLGGYIDSCTLDEDSPRFSISLMIPMDYIVDPFFNFSRVKDSLGVQETPSTIMWKEKAPRAKKNPRSMMFRKLGSPLTFQKQQSIKIEHFPEDTFIQPVPDEFTTDYRRVFSMMSGKNEPLRVPGGVREDVLSAKSIRKDLCERITRKNAVVTSTRNPWDEHPDYCFTSTRQFVTFQAVYTDNASLTLESGKKAILIVEDLENIRTKLASDIKRIVLSEPDVAEDGVQAVQMFKDYAGIGYMYSVIFMDNVMPHMNGIQATRKIRKIEKEKGYPRTFICGISGDKEREEENLNSGMDYFSNFYVVVKPLYNRDIENLLNYEINKFS